MMRFVILGLLRDGEARHGYGLMKEYRHGCGIAVSVGTFYRELDRLTGLGWVQPVARASGTDPRRVCYRITAAGVAQFDRWFAGEGSGPPARVDQLVVRGFLIARVARPLPAVLLARWCDELTHEHQRLGCELAAGDLTDEVPRTIREGLLRRRVKHLAADLELVQALQSACSAVRGRIAQGAPP